MKQGKFRSSPRSVRAARGKKRRLPLAFDGGFNFTIALCRASGALSEDQASREEVARSEPKQEVTGNTETLVEPWNKGTVCLRLPEGHKKIISVSAERRAETQRWLASTQNHTEPHRFPEVLKYGGRPEWESGSQIKLSYKLDLILHLCAFFLPASLKPGIHQICQWKEINCRVIYRA